MLKLLLEQADPAEVDVMTRLLEKMNQQVPAKKRKNKEAAKVQKESRFTSFYTRIKDSVANLSVYETPLKFLPDMSLYFGFDEKGNRRLRQQISMHDIIFQFKQIGELTQIGRAHV